MHGKLFFECLIVIQIIAICLDVFFAVLMLKQKESRLSKLMLCIAFLCIVQNAGYLLELNSVNVHEVMMSVRVEYIAASFIITFVFVFGMEYCGVKLPPWLTHIMFLFDGIVLLSVWTYDLNTIYYKDVIVTMDSVMPQTTFVKGPLYLINGVKLVGIFLADTIVAVRASFKTAELHKRISCILFAVCAGLPFVGYILNFLDVLGGFDPVPALEAIGIFIFGITIFRQHAFDIASVAYENIISEMQDAIVIIDKSGGFVEANKSAKKLFTELVLNKKDSIIKDERLRILLENCIKKNIMSTEYNMKNHIYEVHLSEIVQKRSISGYIVSLFDITDERKRLENMKQLKLAADKANRAKSDFLARMSHEIRSPINAVIGMNEMILRESNENSIKEYALDVRNSANTLLSFINDLLDSSKIESEKMELVPVNYSLKLLIKELENMIYIKAKEKGLLLKLDIDETLPTVLFGDDVRLKQILLNILTNAVKYTVKGNILFSVSGKQKDDKIVMSFSVKDTGIGIKKENIPHLFEAYERISIGKNRYIEGTGLGLNITSQLLKLMDSELKVESTFGEGSRFFFELQQKIVDDTPIGKLKDDIKNEAEEYQYKESFTAPDAKILVVDDNRINLRVFAGLLKNTKIQITCVKSGRECLECVKTQKFDIIFLDHMMPQMDGLETFNHFKNMSDNKCKDTPVVMLTANATNGVKEQYIKEGFDEFMAKPIDAKKLEEMVLKLLPEELIVNV